MVGCSSLSVPGCSVLSSVIMVYYCLCLRVVPYRLLPVRSEEHYGLLYTCLCLRVVPYRLLPVRYDELGNAVVSVTNEDEAQAILTRMHQVAQERLPASYQRDWRIVVPPVCVRPPFVVSVRSLLCRALFRYHFRCC